jgi:hypothetical protein
MKIKINLSAMTIIAASVLVSSCKSDAPILYKAQNFTVYKDKVVQDQNVAEVLSPTAIKSNYKSKENELYSNTIR